MSQNLVSVKTAAHFEHYWDIDREICGNVELEMAPYGKFK